MDDNYDSWLYIIYQNMKQEWKSQNRTKPVSRSQHTLLKFIKGFAINIQ